MRSVDERPDTPRAAYDLLPRTTTAVVVVLLLVAAGLGWAYTVREADSMTGMVTGLGQVGGGMTMAMASGAFMAMWAAMMVAMMAPTVAPVALAHRAALRQSAKPAALTGAFVVGFLLVWSAAGIVGLVAYRAVLELPASAADSRWLPTAAGVVLAAVGVLQFSGHKLRCLRMCRAPRASVHDHAGTNLVTAFGAGLTHGWHCLGCCWALMVVLLIVGVMNLVWMAVIAAIFLLDKHWRRGEGLTRAVGAFFILLGVAVIVFPELLATISGVNTEGPLEMKGEMEM
ncbi:MAG: DUF2182 domain-containing protein [Actinomycetota bacterium]|nr:DUF2182 domain-containing protein [Actinomycetota bacterium]